MGGGTQAKYLNKRMHVSWADEIKYTAVMKVDFPTNKAAAGTKIDFPTNKAAAEMKIICKRFWFSWALLMLCALLCSWESTRSLFLLSCPITSTAEKFRQGSGTERGSPSTSSNPGSSPPSFLLYQECPTASSMAQRRPFLRICIRNSTGGTPLTAERVLGKLGMQQSC